MINVLIVDDDAVAAELNRHYVTQLSGFHCYGTASTLEEAKETVLHSGHHIDLISLDIYIQKEDGLDLLPILHSEGCRCDVTVISSAAGTITIKDPLHYGVVDYLIKPFQVSRLEEAFVGQLHKEDEMDKHQYCEQSELDQLIRDSSSSKQKARRSPRGLTPQVLRTLCQWIDERQDQKFSTDELTNETNIPRVSYRKYFIWFVDCHVLFTNIRYGMTGKPVYRYRVQAGCYPLLKQYCQ